MPESVCRLQAILPCLVRDRPKEGKLLYGDFFKLLKLAFSAGVFLLKCRQGARGKISFLSRGP